MESINARPGVTRVEPQGVARDREIETTVTRYGNRYWSVYLNGELLAVTVYKKGAQAVQNALESLRQENGA